MICDPCKRQQHDQCPTMPKPYDPKKPTVVHPTGLSEENNRIQRSGLCPCHHKVPGFVKSDVGTEFVAQVDNAAAALDALADIT